MSPDQSGGKDGGKDFVEFVEQDFITYATQQSLANAKVSARQQCMYEGP